MIAAVAVAWALCAIGFTAMVLVRLARRPMQPGGSSSAVQLLRPAERLSASERSNLDRPLPALARCFVLGEHDLGPLPAPSVQLRFTPNGINRKLSLLKAALRERPPRPGEHLVICDADVIVDGALLSNLTGALNEGGDLVMAGPLPDFGDGGSTFLRRVSMASGRGLLGHSAHAFAALRTVDAHAFCGKAIALSPRAIEQLLLLEDCIGEDLRLAEAVLSAGGRVECIREPARTLPSPGLARFRRWQLVAKTHRPLAFLAGPWFLAPMLPLMTLAAVVRLPLLSVLVGVLFTMRVLLARKLCRPHAWTFILGEALYLCSFIAALFVREVDWRGRSLRPSRGGSLAQGAS